MKLNSRLKRWPGWLLLVVVIGVALTVGATRSGGPLTQDDRADGIAQRLACPTCDGESVYESQAPAADDIRQQINKFIQAGQSDSQIISYLEERDSQVLLVPKATGFDSLVWIVPVFAFVCAIAALAVAFRRWKVGAESVPTEQDRAMVADAMRNEQGRE